VLSEAGAHDGFIRTTASEPKYGGGDAVAVEAKFQRDADIRTQVRDSKPPFSDLMAWIAVVIGIAISLSNLIAFIWKWNDRYRQRSSELEADRKIIVP
jgi:hypothetical protein